ncbi:hypothetical protein REPUB_Repub12eG0203100 [Reevesia pubescens]
MERKRDSKQDYFIPPVLNGDGNPPFFFCFSIYLVSFKRLVLYPNGNKNNNGDGFISLYLGIEETENLPLNWEVNVEFKLFVLDQIHDQYLAVKDVGESIRRFHQMKTEWGFSRFLSVESFNDASNGYLFEDSCIFGAEVFVIERSGVGERLSIIKNPNNSSITWKIENFSELLDQVYYSPAHSIEDTKWKLAIFPKGNSNGKGKALSVYLCLAEPDILPPKQKLYVEFRLRLRDQIKSNHHERTVKQWFSSSIRSLGYPEFESLTNLHDVSKGYIKNGVVIVEAEVIVITKVECFS